MTNTEGALCVASAVCDEAVNVFFSKSTTNLLVSSVTSTFNGDALSVNDGTYLPVDLPCASSTFATIETSFRQESPGRSIR